MRSGTSTRRNIIVLAAIAAACLTASGQAYKVRPGTIRARPQYIFGGTLTLSASPTAVSFNLVPNGTALGSSGVTVTTTWNVFGIDTTLNVYGYFSSATAALSNGASPANVIPSSAVLGQVTTGVPTSYTPFTQTTPFNGAASGLLLATETQSIATNGSRTDVLNLEINLSNVNGLAAGTYTGTLTLQATMN